MYERIYYNSFLRLYLEEYLAIAIACLIKLYALDFTNLFEGFSSTFAILMAVWLTACPFLLGVFFQKHIVGKTKMNKEFLKKFGTLTLDL